MAIGEYIGLLDHDDVLAANALYEVVRMLNAHPDAQVIYSDEDKLMQNPGYTAGHILRRIIIRNC